MLRFNWRRAPERDGLEREPGGPAPIPGASELELLPPGGGSELSATLFDGEPPAWARYLSTSPERRCDSPIRVDVHVHAGSRSLAFEPRGEGSLRLASLLSDAFAAVDRELAIRPNVRRAFDELIFGNAANQRSSVCLRLSSLLPSDGTRESDRSGGDIRIVLNEGLTHFVSERLSQVDPTCDARTRIGLAWPLLSRLISALAYPADPRDRFVAKIAVVAKVTFVALHLLYEPRPGGGLSPTSAGAVYEQFVADACALPRAQLWQAHPYFRMLSRLGFLLRGSAYREYEREAGVAAREYLDAKYLRLSLATAMPGIAPTMRPMALRRAGRRLATPRPRIGEYGIVDNDDLQSWRAVQRSFRDIGFTLLRQLGIGEFGRVYEALNENNPHLPGRVALKVDRITGKRKQSILGAEQAMEVGAALAVAPHVVRLYDGGRLLDGGHTYHVLQLIDGDTLDNLLGVAGLEHASVSAPPSGRRSRLEAEQEWQRAVGARQSEAWRRARSTAPFTHDLTPAMVLDLLTSILLWLEEVHGLGYATNDLKHGNLMLSRRGQLKGIDLDSYARAHSPLDRITDFMFLAVSLILLLLSTRPEAGQNLAWEELVGSPLRFEKALTRAWPFGDVEACSEGRVSQPEMLELLVELVQRSRQLDYAHRPELFSADVVRLIDLKRRLLVAEVVID